MNERANLEVIAPSVEEAVAQGLADLGMTAEDVDVEVLDSGSKGLFGIGGRQVRVRLTVKGQESQEATTAPAVVEPVADAEVGSDELGPRSEDVVRIAEDTVMELIDKMRIQAHVHARLGEVNDNGERPVWVDIRGDDLGVLIGRRAEILNSLQYIVNLIVSKQVEHWVQVVVDVEGYRARRERQLRQIAVRMADQAVKTGKRQVLEPMSPGDRRIIHMELHNHPNVVTQSIGEEPVRKVTISPK